MNDKKIDTTHNPGFKGWHHGRKRHTSHATLPAIDHQNNIDGNQSSSEEDESEVVTDSE